MVSSSALLSDTILFVRNTLRDNITDPLGSGRPAGEKFVMTSYPRRTTVYPLITVRGKLGPSTPLGHWSEKQLMTIIIEVRVWARQEKEKNNLQDSVFDYMRLNQHSAATSGTSLNENLFDFGLNFANDLDDKGDEGIKSKVSEYSFRFIA